MFGLKEPLLPLTLVGFEEGAIAGACRHEVGDVDELEGASSQGQVGVVAFDGQIDARAMDQVGNQDIFQHVQIVFARVETYHNQFVDASRSAVVPFFPVNGWLLGQEPLAKRPAVAPANGDRLDGKTKDRLPLLGPRFRRHRPPRFPRHCPRRNRHSPPSPPLAWVHWLSKMAVGRRLPGLLYAL